MGGAIIFVVSIVGDVVLGGVFLCYASHCFLTVLADSSGGVDEVRWPEDEGIFDWFLKAAYCVWVLAFWLLTATLTLAPFVVWNFESYVVFVAVVVWLMHPVGTLSTLSTRNWFFMVWPPLLLQMARHPRALLVAYLSTLPLLAATVGLILGIAMGRFWLLFPAAVVLPAALLFYARAWGQTAWLVLNWERRPKKEREPKERALEVDDPWAGPEEDEIPELEVEEIIDDPHGKRAAEDPDDEWSLKPRPYGLSEEAADAEGAAVAAGPPPMNRAKQMAEYLDEDHKKGVERRRRAERLRAVYDRRPPTFSRAMGRRLFLFLTYPATLRAWLSLALATLLALAMFTITLTFFPGL